MSRKSAKPIITHTEIYARAIRSIDEEIQTFRNRCEGTPLEGMLPEMTAELQIKRSTLADLYQIECGTDFT